MASYLQTPTERAGDGKFILVVGSFFWSMPLWHWKSEISVHASAIFCFFFLLPLLKVLLCCRWNMKLLKKLYMAWNLAFCSGIICYRTKYIRDLSLLMFDGLLFSLLEIIATWNVYVALLLLPMLSFLDTVAWNCMFSHGVVLFMKRGKYKREN